jgi:diacylglycerol kinase (ATP)
MTSGAKAIGEVERDPPVSPPRCAPRLLLVANGNASGLGRQRQTLDRAASLLRSAGGVVEARLTSSIDELDELVRAGPERRLVLLGGDGTLHAVANLPGPKPEIALLPAGKANNIARSLGVPAELPAAAELAVNGHTRPLDVIVATSDERRHVAVEGVSVGFLALARAGYRGRNSADLVAGVRAGAAALRAFDPLCVSVEAEGAGERLRVGQLFVANLPLYSYGLRVAPMADPADGLLDLTAIEARNRLSLLLTLARLRRRPEQSCPGYRCWRERRVRIATSETSPIIADSTNLGVGPVELAVEPAALAVVAPMP